jgi:aspartyl-tRNA(Asn)/glutamyl-tRNA(Gln) amidotransferase subunit A
MLPDTNYAADAGRIAELQRDIRLGALSSRALVERCLARIEAINPVVQAWRHVAYDTARAEADLLDREAKAGRFRRSLHGIPVGIKDVIDVAGMTTLANSKSRLNSAPATADAEIVAVLRLAGAVILGKTHTTEFGFFDPSPARNPHNIAHTPGGSSSGSAAAVSAGAAPSRSGLKRSPRSTGRRRIAALRPLSQAPSQLVPTALRRSRRLLIRSAFSARRRGGALRGGRACLNSVVRSRERPALPYRPAGGPDARGLRRSDP